MVTAYRLFRSRYEPWDTTGAMLRGGRWNSPGNGVIYTSATLSLACLEVLVHIRDPYLVPHLNYCRIEFPNHCVERWPFEADTARSQAILDSEVLSREFADGWLGGASSGEAGLFQISCGRGRLGAGTRCSIGCRAARMELSDQPQSSLVLENSVVSSLEIQD